MSVQLYQGDCLEVMKDLPPGSVDAVITDPPYGCGKAEWDNEFPSRWYTEARRVAPMVAIITGSSGLKDSIPLVGADFVDVISARNLNGMTRSPLGFGNWLACVVAGKKPAQGVTFFEFAVRGEMPPHPSPKPIEYMRKLIARLTEPGDTVFDPFTGSGTTAQACVELGRNFIGCEINPEYYAYAMKRIEQAQMQPYLSTIGATATGGNNMKDTVLVSKNDFETKYVSRAAYDALRAELDQAEEQANTLYTMLVTAHGRLVFMGRFYQPIYKAIQSYIAWRTAQADQDRQP